MILRDFQQGDPKQFVSGFLRGFRAWWLDGDALQSISHPIHLWKPGRNDAVCMNKMAMAQWDVLQPAAPWRKNTFRAFENHEPPSMDAVCATCGFYGFHKPETLDADMGYMQRTPYQIGGSIKATGSIILATLGFRAQRAEVEALYGGFGTGGEEVAEHYGVPWFKTRAELVEQFPFVPLEGHEYEDPILPNDFSHIPSTAYWLPAKTKAAQYQVTWSKYIAPDDNA